MLVFRAAAAGFIIAQKHVLTLVEIYINSKAKQPKCLSIDE
jgi:hypothetical protein